MKQVVSIILLSLFFQAGLLAQETTKPSENRKFTKEYGSIVIKSDRKVIYPEGYVRPVFSKEPETIHVPGQKRAQPVTGTMTFGKEPERKSVPLNNEPEIKK